LGKNHERNYLQKGWTKFYRYWLSRACHQI